MFLPRVRLKAPRAPCRVSRARSCCLVPALSLLARPGTGQVEEMPGPRLQQEEQPLLSQLLLLLWDSACTAWHALRAALALLPCLAACCLAAAPAPLPRLAPARLAALLALAAEVAGPVYVKLAQWAATRRDLLPESVCLGLARLQTQAAPHSWAATERILKEDFGPGFKDFFGRLWLEDRRPVASGCCAQVYHGWLDGREVAVKVVHPTLRRQLQLDLALLSGLARLVTWLLPSAAWLALPAAVTEFEGLMTGQLDMVEEARNLDRFRENFKDNDDIIFPEPLTEFCRSRVLVETWLSGRPISLLLEPGAAPADRRRLAGLGADMLLHMVFRDNFWHADLHPGNLLVTAEGRLAVLDAGLSCSLGRSDRASLAATFRAVVAGDGARVGELFLERSRHDCRDPQAFVAELRETVGRARDRRLCLETVDVSQLLQEVFQTLSHHRVRLEAGFLSLIIAVAIVEGLGRSLDSKLDLVTRALPHVLAGKV